MHSDKYILFSTFASLMSYCTTVVPAAWNPFNYIHSAQQHWGWHLRQPGIFAFSSSSLQKQVHFSLYTHALTHKYTCAVSHWPSLSWTLFLIYLLPFHFSSPCTSWVKKEKKKKEVTLSEKQHCGYGEGCFLSLVSLRVFFYSSGQGSQASKGGNLMQITLKGFIT